MRTQGARSNDKSLANEPADHALGRSRGGPSTKIHALTDTFCCPLTLLLSPGHRRQPLPGAAARRAPRPRHRSVPPAGRQGVLAPEHPSTRKNLRKSRILRTTPERRDQIRRRKAKGSGGGSTADLRQGPLPRTQRHRAWFRASQAVARHRHSLRQVRHHLPRWRTPRCARHSSSRP